MILKKKQGNKQVKLLVSIINKSDHEKLTETINQYATAMHFSGFL